MSEKTYGQLVAAVTAANSEDEMIEALGISPSSPEAWAASIVWEALKETNDWWFIQEVCRPKTRQYFCDRERAMSYITECNYLVVAEHVEKRRIIYFGPGDV